MSKPAHVPPSSKRYSPVVAGIGSIIDPFEFLPDVFARLPAMSSSQLEDVTPALGEGASGEGCADRVALAGLFG
ncbi:MAG: hypothetical protein JSR82_14800 [Verrucomicrobia bacterium]|nr:hypothetical protein [Verrucomicrobiota bacterium]